MESVLTSRSKFFYQEVKPRIQWLRDKRGSNICHTFLKYAFEFIENEEVDIKELTRLANKILNKFNYLKCNLYKINKTFNLTIEDQVYMYKFILEDFINYYDIDYEESLIPKKDWSKNIKISSKT